MDPTFDQPPVIERVIGVQFSELNFFTNAHAGWFWKSFLDSEWTHVNEAPKIEDRFERFDSQMRGRTLPPFRVMTEPPAERHQIIRKSDDRMLQIQNTRFLLNWRKKEDQPYLDYEEMFKEFVQYLELFKSFVAEASDEELNLNQWEITYINHINKGELWNTIDEWKSVFPFLSFPKLKSSEGRIQTMDSKWAITLTEDIGRLYITLKHALSGGPEGPEIILLDMTSRGSINETMSFEQGLSVGHSAIVNTFADITSENAHKQWRRIS